MDITPLVPAGRKMIEAYGAGGFVISGDSVTGPVLLFENTVLPWSVDSFASITLDSLQPVIESDPSIELLLIGSGVKMEMLGPEIRQAMRNHRIGVDVMDTGAVCRTWNVLLSEGRRVAAALLPV